MCTTWLNRPVVSKCLLYSHLSVLKPVLFSRMAVARYCVNMNNFLDLQIGEDWSNTINPRICRKTYERTNNFCMYLRLCIFQGIQIWISSSLRFIAAVLLHLYGRWLVKVATILLAFFRNAEILRWLPVIQTKYANSVLRVIAVEWEEGIALRFECLWWKLFRLLKAM